MCILPLPRTSKSKGPSFQTHTWAFKEAFLGSGSLPSSHLTFGQHLQLAGIRATLLAGLPMSSKREGENTLFCLRSHGLARHWHRLVWGVLWMLALPYGDDPFQDAVDTCSQCRDNRKEGMLKCVQGLGRGGKDSNIGFGE